jgi:hypothetical protein
VISVNTGRGKDADWGKLGRTAIDKRPVAGRAEQEGSRARTASRR